ncbi:MAG: diguanylate cyclase [Crocosphaera sp.]
MVKRSGDLVARFGGEEFAIILPNTDLNGAEIVAQLIIEEIKSLNIPHKGSKVSDDVTISLGIASIIPTHQTPSKKVIDLADDALYQAKRQGRNRYFIL